MSLGDSLRLRENYQECISQSSAVVQCEILNLAITFISPSENESGTAGVRCAGGAVTVTGVPEATAWCVDNICTCG